MRGVRFAVGLRAGILSSAFGALIGCGGRGAPVEADLGAAARDGLAATLRTAPHEIEPIRAGAIDLVLPLRAALPFVARDRRSGVGAEVRVVGAAPVEGAGAARRLRFAGALDRGDLVREVVRDGVEDSVVFGSRPESGALRWNFVPNSQVAGLRLVAGVLELIDDRGAPRLRVERPFTIDARGVKRAATLDVEGCAVDRSPAPPWGRAFVRPVGACTLIVRFDAEAPTYPLTVDPVWRATTSMSEARAHPIGANVTIGGTRAGWLVVGGDGAAAASAEYFDPPTATWATAPSPPNPFFGDAVPLLTRGSLFLGAPPAIFDDGTNTWRSVAAPASEHRRGAMITEWPAAKILLVGGRTASGDPDSTAEVFDTATETWSSAPPIPEARYDATASYLSATETLVVGGTGAGGVALASASIFDAGTSTWRAAAPLPGPLHGHRALAIFSGAFTVVLGGPAYEYEAAADTWRTLAVNPARVDGAVAWTSGSTGLFIGGADPASGVPAAPALLYRYGGAGSTIVPAGALTTPRRGAAALTIGNGVVLVTGGLDASGNALSTAEILTMLPDGATCASDAECGVDAFCAGGHCAPKLANGAAETLSAHCASGFVADGVCCDVACTGACEACDGANPGTCAPIAGDPRHGTCAAPVTGQPCTQRACDGKDGATCAGYVGAEIECRAHDCQSGVETLAAACDGKGACPAPATKTCTPYVCDGKQCRATCRSAADCVAGSICDDAKTCQAPVCIDGHTLRVPETGLALECAPFACADGACRNPCQSTDDCTVGFTCEITSGACVQSSTPSGGGSDGGGCQAGQGASGLAGGVAILALVGAIARKRR